MPAARQTITFSGFFFLCLSPCCLFVSAANASNIWFEFIIISVCLFICGFSLCSGISTNTRRMLCFSPQFPLTVWPAAQTILHGHDVQIDIDVAINIDIAAAGVRWTTGTFDSFMQMQLRRPFSMMLDVCCVRREA